MDTPLLVLDPETLLQRNGGRMRLVRATGARPLDLDLGEDLGAAFAEALVDGAPLEPLVASVGDDFDRLTRARIVLAGLARVEALTLRVDGNERSLAGLRPASPRLVLGGVVPRSEPLQLSRFASLHREGNRLVLRSPLADGALIFEDPAVAAALITDLATGVSSAEIADRRGPAMGLLAALLDAAGFCATEQEDDDPELAAWEPHDLAFHRRSRIGAHGGGIGPTYRLRGRVPSAPARGPDRGGRRLVLPTPRAPLSPTFGEVLERRRSIRDHADTPISREALGALLYHALRVVSVTDDDEGEVAWRPFPSAGARHPLETYLCLDRVEDVPRGVYRYDPFSHELETIDAPAGALGRLLADAAIGRTTPAVLLSIAARFRRTTFKYESIAYALILKDAAVMMQTLHLVATALGLASCMVGTGDPRRLATAIGSDVHAESSVAELVVGVPVA